MKPLKLSEVARRLGITKCTLYNWKALGKVNFIKIGNINYISYDDFCDLAHIENKKEEKVVIYCRVSSSQNKSNLETQAERVISFCYAKGYKVTKVIKEIGSGLNDSRPKLCKLLDEGDFTKIVIVHKDRLTRVGFNFIKVLLSKQGKEIEVINDVTDDKEDLLQDFISIITSYCARIYGSRRCKRKTEKIIEELNSNDNES